MQLYYAYTRAEYKFGFQTLGLMKANFRKKNITIFQHIY